ncbi:hypothetical protein AAG906_012346 [Vitis piasezkii]
MIYANHVAKSCQQILNWSVTSISRFTELQQIFLDSNMSNFFTIYFDSLSLCSLLKPTSKECQQDYYKYVNKLRSVNGVAPEILSQPTTPKHDTMGDLKDEDHPDEANAYVAAATMENKKKKDYSITPSIESPFTNPTKRMKIRKEQETTSEFNHLQSISEEAREAFHKWLSLQQGAVILRVKNSGTLNGCMMFLNKSMSNSLTGARIDWFREKMTIELFYFKILPM